MKVAFLGNMNNMNFSLVRYLRDEGVDANLFLYSDENEHFLPGCDSYQLDYKSYVHSLTWGSLSKVCITSSNKIKNDIEGYDFYVGCGPAPAYLRKAGMKLDVFIPYGADIWAQTFYNYSDPLQVLYKNYAVYFQKRGIRDSEIFHMPHTNAFYEKRWNILKGKGERWLNSVPLVYHKIYDPEGSEQTRASHWVSEFRKIRQSSDLMVMSHTRQYWKDLVNYPDDKGNDKLFKAWALFVKKVPTAKATLVVFEYGKDVEASKQLVRELNIESSVVWMPKMYRKDLMPGLFMSDLVCGEFRHSWIASGVLHEAMIAKKPILAHREDSLYDETELYPILNAGSIQDISRSLEDFYVNRHQFQDYGAKAYSWYQNNVIQQSVKKYLDLFSKKKFENLTAKVLFWLLSLSSLDDLVFFGDLV